MKSKLEMALAKAKENGHVLEHDPPYALASVDRYTCKNCGLAVLGNFSTAYGLAIELGACPSSQVKRHARKV